MKKPSKEALELSRHIHTFIDDYAPSQRTTSTNTLKSYNTALTLYIEFLEKAEGITDKTLCAACFEQPVIERWLTWLKESRNCSPETCNVRLSSLRVFLHYLSSRDIKYIYLSNGADMVKPRKTLKKHVSGMSRNAVKAITDEPDASTKIGKRDITFIVILYATAARMDEMLDMKISQLHLDDETPYVTIIGKGRKLRNIYLLPKAVAHMKSYLNVFHGDSPNEEDYVFYSRNKGKQGKLSQTAIDKMLKKHALAAHEKCPEVPIKVHAHQFRHAKASHWLEDGMNIAQISFLLGHADIKTTMIYLDITIEAELKAMATLEDELDHGIKKKWRNSDGSLKSFCGLRRTY